MSGGEINRLNYRPISADPRPSGLPTLNINSTKTLDDNLRDMGLRIDQIDPTPTPPVTVADASSISIDTSEINYTGNTIQNKTMEAMSDLVDKVQSDKDKLWLQNFINRGQADLFFYNQAGITDVTVNAVLVQTRGGPALLRFASTPDGNGVFQFFDKGPVAILPRPEGENFYFYPTGNIDDKGNVLIAPLVYNNKGEVSDYSIASDGGVSLQPVGETERFLLLNAQLIPKGVLDAFELNNSINSEIIRESLSSENQIKYDSIISEYPNGIDAVINAATAEGYSKFIWNTKYGALQAERDEKTFYYFAKLGTEGMLPDDSARIEDDSANGWVIEGPSFASSDTEVVILTQRGLEFSSDDTADTESYVGLIPQITDQAKADFIKRLENHSDELGISGAKQINIIVSSHDLTHNVSSNIMSTNYELDLEHLGNFQFYDPAGGGVGRVERYGDIIDITVSIPDKHDGYAGTYGYVAMKTALGALLAEKAGKVSLSLLDRSNSITREIVDDLYKGGLIPGTEVFTMVPLDNALEQTGEARKQISDMTNNEYLRRSGAYEIKGRSQKIIDQERKKELSKSRR